MRSGTVRYANTEAQNYVKKNVLNLNVAINLLGFGCLSVSEAK